MEQYTSALSVTSHKLEIYTSKLVITGVSSGPFRRASDLVNRKDRNYLSVDEAVVTPIGRPNDAAPLITPFLVARQNIHFISLVPQPEPEQPGPGVTREFVVRKNSATCSVVTQTFTISGQCHLLQGTTLENLLETGDTFISITGATICLSVTPANTWQRDLVILNKQKIEGMYILPAPPTSPSAD